jgi:hypothetical protein
MKSLKVILLLLIACLLIQCSKDDVIIVDTDVTTLTDNEDVSFLINLVDELGAPISGASLINQLNGNTYTSDERGLFLLTGLSIPATGLPVSIEMEGWVKVIKILNGVSDSHTSMKIEMYKYDMETTISTGNTGSISQGGQLRLPGTLVRADNSTYTGEVIVKSFYYDPTRPGFLEQAPGNMSAIGAGNQLYTLMSYGMYAIDLFDESGNELNIPNGETATIQFPIPDNYPDAPAEIPLWSMNEVNGKWIEEGVAVRNGSFYEAEVTHFSWWNCDIPFNPVELCMRLLDLNGQPIANANYLIHTSNPFVAYASGTTDQNGNLCSGVPQGEPVAISILLDEELSEATDLGAFNAGEDIGDVTINAVFLKVTGVAVDCDNTSISSAYVRYEANNQQAYVLTDDDGVFTITLFEQGDLQLKVFDFENPTQSEVITLAINEEQQLYELGDIPVCDEISAGEGIAVTGNISSNTTWSAGFTYILVGRVVVEPGATLTIEPGVVVKGELGAVVNASFLMVARGATLIAEGTPQAPIIFTSVADDITPEDVAAGNFQSPNLSPSLDIGLWGGIMILGSAPISASVNTGGASESVEEISIESLLPQDPLNFYGGLNENDNSGILRYISIRHAGVNWTEGVELNGLTIAGVGSGTTIDNIEVVGTLDDGIEWFGGTVDVSNVVVWNAGDDAIDTDQSWGGTLDGVVVIVAGGSCFELDGPEGELVARHTIQNGTIVANANGLETGGSLIDLDNNTPADLKNIHFVGPFVDGQTMTEDEVFNATFDNVTFDVVDVQSLMEQGGTVPSGISSGGTPQADVSGFNWTWAAQSGSLDGL